VVVNEIFAGTSVAEDLLDFDDAYGIFKLTISTEQIRPINQLHFLFLFGLIGQ
jgi:hypothetical protein